MAIKSKTIGLLDGTEATRIYAPRKRTIAFLSKLKLDYAGVTMENKIDREGNVVRWEDAVAPYADILYLPFPWMLFHRLFKEGLGSNLWVAFAKRYPQKGDLVFCPTLPNIDPHQIAQQCNAHSLAAQIELFWNSYFMLDEHPYGTKYGQLIFGGLAPPVEEEEDPSTEEDSHAREEKRKALLAAQRMGNSGRLYYERWLKLEPEEVCGVLRPVPPYSGMPVEDFLIGNMRPHLGDYYMGFEKNYTLLLDG